MGSNSPRGRYDFEDIPRLNALLDHSLLLNLPWSSAGHTGNLDNGSGAFTTTGLTTTGTLAVTGVASINTTGGGRIRLLGTDAGTVPAEDTGGNIQWFKNASESAGFTFADSVDGDFVWSETAESTSGPDRGVASISFTTGAFECAAGAFDVDASGNIIDVGFITSDSTIECTDLFLTSPNTKLLDGVAGGGLAMEGQATSTQFRLQLHTKDADGTDSVALDLYSRGSPTDQSNRERLSVQFTGGATSVAQIQTESAGTGTDRDLLLRAGVGNANQLYLQASTGNVGMGTSTPDTKLQVVGTSGFGDDSGNETLISATGDMTFVGTAGLPFGNMYGFEIAETVTIGSVNQWEEVAASMTANTNLNLVTFQNNNELVVTNAGKYKVIWSMSLQVNAANQELMGSITIDSADAGVAIGAASECVKSASAHQQQTTANKSVCVAGATICDLTAGQTLSFVVLNESAANDITVEHANMTISMVGG